ncbi:hypothetical protein Q8G71_35805, partial [Klebsiella pneumoniae]
KADLNDTQSPPLDYTTALKGNKKTAPLDIQKSAYPLLMQEQLKKLHQYSLGVKRVATKKSL